MSRLFDGQFATESVTFSAGTAPPDEGPITIAVLVKPQTTISSATCWMISGIASGSPVWGMLTDTGVLFLNNDFTSGGPTVTGGTNWFWIVVTKASGSVTPRYHIKNVTTSGAWSHTNGSGNVADGTGPITSIIVGNDSAAGTNDWRGSIAAIALWDTALADLSVEAACTLAASDLAAAAPKWGTLWNQASTGTAPTDFTGGGSSQSAISGTSVDADDPPGWSYALTASTTNYAGPFLGRAPGRLSPTGQLSPAPFGDAKTARVAAAGTASEADSALALGRAKARTLGAATETDAAQPVSRAKARSLGIAAEANTAQPVGRVKAMAAGVASETDAAQQITGLLTAPVPFAGPWTGVTPGWLSPTGWLAPQPFGNAVPGNVTTATIGVAGETDTAQPLGRSKVRAIGVASTTDVAVSAGRSKKRAIGIAAETDSALVITTPGHLSGTANTATETDTAQPLGRAKRRTAGVATTTDAALAMARRKTRAVGIAVSLNTAGTIQNPHTAVCGSALEVDTTPTPVRGHRITRRPYAGVTPRPNIGITYRPG